MKGKHTIVIKNARLQYKFTIERNITILRGDSATGKTTLIDMIGAYQRNGQDSGVSLNCDKPCVVLTSMNWQVNLDQIHDSIVFIDEGDPFVKTHEFAQAVENSDNYYVIATRSSLFMLPYSVQEIYGIKNTAANRYQGTKRLYSVFYPLYKPDSIELERPDCVIVEDSNAGFEFFAAICARYDIPCISAKGKSNVFETIVKTEAENTLVIADGAAFGPELERLLELRRAKKIMVFLPESFEWLILKSGIVTGVNKELENTSDYVESKDYFSWERFFTDLLVSRTQDSYLAYSKRKLNAVYLQENESAKIIAVIQTTSKPE